ncbi:MAG: alpha/beta fold hydrolase [bacterium]|nr:alpha/beta fold hydrolase [bacterium]
MKIVRMFIRILVVLLLLFKGETIYGEQQHYTVGMRHISTSIQPEDVEMHIMVWYPTSEHAQHTKIGPFEMEVVRDANVEPGTRSFIVISHGDGGSHLNHRDTAAYLAKRGYIVAAVLHPHNNYRDNSEEGTYTNLVNRPRQISQAIDTLLNQHVFKETLDPHRIAVIGHSAGAYTALALAGGIPNTATIRVHCNTHHDDPIFCRNFGMLSTIKGYFSPQERWVENVIDNTDDPRIKAAVLMAPVGVLFNDDQSLSNVRVPLRIYRAEHDDVLRSPYHAEFLKEHLSRQPEYIVVNNAGHYSFLSPIPESMKHEIGEVASDPTGFDRVQFHTTMNQEIAEFLSRSLSQ